MDATSQEEIIQIYHDRIFHFSQELAVNKKRSLHYSLMRLATIIIAIPFIYLATKFGLLAVIASLIIVIIIFVFAVLRQQQYDKKTIENQLLIAINENEIQSILQLKNDYYNGEQFKESHHFYTDDLDIFGNNSIFGLINRSKTFNGTHQLATYFLELPEINSVEERQLAIQELESKLDWRQNFSSSLFNIEGGHQRDLAKEIDEELKIDLSFAKGKFLTIFIKALPYLWMVIFGLYFFDIALANTIAGALFIANLLITMRKSSEVTAVQAHLSYASNMLKSYSEALKIIFSENWNSKLIQQKSEFYKSPDNSNGTVSMLKILSGIIDHLDYRLNFIPAIILNGLFLWDFRVINRLSNWKSIYDGQLIKLFDFIGTMESLNSLASWSYNNPQYVYTKFHEVYFSLEATEIQHPLIPKPINVANNFNIKKSNHLSIITGSNMSGKSTLLRTLGINTILAYTGGRVAAKSFSIPIVQLISYMRIKDILEESVSTFKAELNRIDMILKMLKSGTKCFILIDEMLRGTNSVDKLTGSIGIAKRLLAENTYAMIATHDIKLAELSSEYPESIANYFFDIDYADGDLIFDFKVKEGICKNFNASFLLKQLGIDMP